MFQNKEDMEKLQKLGPRSSGNGLIKITLNHSLIEI